MKINFYIPIFTSVVLLSGCSSPSDTNLVKTGVLEFNKTLTVGEAFDRWKECKQKEWKEFSSDNGQRVVQFTCYSNNATEFLAKVSTSESVSDELNKVHLKFKGLATAYQWTINKDNSFQLAHVESKWSWADGKIIETPGDIESSLRSVYANEATFDMSSLESLNSEQSTQSSLNALKTVMAYDRMMYGLYMEAK